jgi:large subunit ribosomal protein L21
MTFAVIKTGGKQYKVAANDVVKIEKIAGEPGDVVTFDQILMVGNGDDVTIGAPLVEGALVAAHFVSTEKQRTVIIQKKHRRQHFDRRNGHRQLLSTVKIAEILIGGAKPTVAVDEKMKARYAAKSQDAASVSSAEVAPAAAKPARKAPAKKVAPAADTEAPAVEAAPAEVEAKPAAKKAPAKKAAPKKAAAEGEAAPKKEAAAKKAPAAKKEAAPKKAAAKKAPKADKE